jgi:hypothetical protein
MLKAVSAKSKYTALSPIVGGSRQIAEKLMVRLKTNRLIKNIN